MFRPRVSVVNPAHPASIARLDEADPFGPSIAARGERVAIIDDEEVMVSVAKSVLKKLGYTTTAYNSAAGFLNAYTARPERINLVISDVVMPGMTGMQLVRHLREQGHDVPILLMTGFDLQPRLAQVPGPGRISIVRKPFTCVHLGQAVRRLLSN